MSLADEVIDLLTQDGPVEVPEELMTKDGWPITLDYQNEDDDEQD